MEKLTYEGMPVFKSRAANHEEAKNIFWNHFQDSPNYGIESKGIKLTSCDWHVKAYEEKPYFDSLKQSIYHSLNFAAQKMGFENWNIMEYWYQLYQKNDFHEWHVHGNCMFTGVYYLNLPKKSAPHLHCVYQDKDFYIPVSEGDIIIFPSFIYHRASKHPADDPKVVFSFNVNFSKGTGYVRG